MKKLLLLLSIPVVALSSLFSTYVAHAESAYDDVVHTTDSLMLQSSNGEHSLDITTSYMGYIMGTLPTVTNGCNDSCKTIINDSLDHGQWYVSQHQTSDTYHDVFARFHDVDHGTLSFAALSGENHKWLYTSDEADGNVVCAWVRLWDDGGIRVRTDDYCAGSAEYDSSASIPYIMRPFISTYAVNYPSGYAGVLVPDSTSGDSDSDEVKAYVDFTFTANGLDFSANYKDTYTYLPDATIGDKTFLDGVNYVDWYIVRDHLGEDSLNPLPTDEASRICNAHLPIGETFNWSNCYRSFLVGGGKYLSPGMTGDFHIVARPSGDDGEGLTLDSYTVTIASSFINFSLPTDGIISSSTDDPLCNKVNFADSPGCDGFTQYESCDIGDVPCYLRNGSRALQYLLIFLFVPRNSVMAASTARFQSWGIAHLGAAWQGTSWLTTTFHDAFLDSSSIICNHDFGTFFGSHFVFNQCVVEQKYPAMWGVITSVVRGTAIFALIFMWYRCLRGDVLRGSIGRIIPR